MDYILKTESLTKRFGKKEVVSQVNMHIERGSIYGLIGRNGAGKTTIMRMIVGLAAPTDGSIELFGTKNYLKQCTKVGCAIENPALYYKMNAYDNLLFYNKFLGIKDKENIPLLLKKVGLDANSKQKVKTFSLGMKQRLSIAIALIGNPEFLVLDEPINGLDPSGIKEVRELIVKLKEEDGITVLISSHILGELDKMATSYGIIDRGRIIEELSKDDMDHASEKSVVIQSNQPEQVVALLKEKFSVEKTEITENGAVILKEQIDNTATINKELALADILVDSIKVESKGLEEHFMKLLGGE